MSEEYTQTRTNDKSSGNFNEKTDYNAIGGCRVVGRWSEKEHRSIPLDKCMDHGLMTKEEYDYLVEYNRKVESGEFAKENWPELFNNDA